MKLIRKKLKDNKGIGVIEMILILLVLVGLIVIFRSQLTDLVNSVFSNINRKVNAF